MRFAHFDHTATGPTRVLGWYDTVTFEYPSMPPNVDLLPMTDQQWAARMDQPWAVGGGMLVPWTPPQVILPPPVFMLPKLLVVERIAAAGKLRDARAALRLGVADSALTDAELVLRERWQAAQDVASDDADMRHMLTVLGLDPSVILAAP